MGKFAGNLLESLSDDATPEAEMPPPIAARVLIIDDEPCVCELLGEMLELMGHRARQCNSPLDALKFIECEDFDVILSDFRMPQMNGDQFYAQAIQKRPDLARRIVFLTGDLVNEETQAFLKESGSLSIEKPFQLAAVEEMIARIAGGQTQAGVQLKSLSPP